uniref:tRNA-dihydrouridine(47) synthase [NAD(P)(+)] n=1 Tax=Moniliophthora roreri TaxID=221103 RepID=A0A0W0FRA7_MONRR
MSATQWPPGTAPIKAEYLVHHTLTSSSIADDDAAGSNTTHSNPSHTNGRDSRDDRDKGNKNAKAPIKIADSKRSSEAGVLELIKDEEKKARTAISMQAVNFVSPDKQKLLRTKKLPFPIWETYQKEVKALNKEQKPEAAVTQDADGDVVLAETARDDPAPVPRPSTIQSHEPTSPDDIDTSLGNLPFRRSYVDYGADITCGEMVLATSFLSGSKEEWPLVRRHPSEKAFGVQVAGSKLNALVPTAENAQQNGGIDLLWMTD